MILLARNRMFHHALVYSCLIIAIAGSEPCADLDPMGCANNPNLCDDPILAKDICANSCNLCEDVTTQTSIQTTESSRTSPTITEMHTTSTTTAKSITTTTATQSPTISTTENSSTTTEATTIFGQVMDGGWSEWSTSATCSKTCGHGSLTQRHRTCTDPPPSNGGNTCSGPNLMLYNCPFVNCPDAVLDGTWKDWGKWSECFGQCGVAKRYRFRDCVTSVNNGSCAGEKIGSTPCSDTCYDTTLPPTTTAVPTTTTTTRATTTSSNAFWKDWEEWSKCFGQCGVAKRFRFRDCVTSGNNDTCVGEKIGSTPCSDPCNVEQTTLQPTTTTAAPATTTTTMATTTKRQTTCPKSWIKKFSSCYYFGLDKRSWTSSKIFCNSFNGDLVKIDNAYEDNYLVSVLGQRATSIAWIGGKATALGRHFVWMWGNSENPFRYTNWLPGEPNDYHFTDACAAIRNSIAGYYWEDGRCVSLQNFICEISLHESTFLIG